MIGVIMTNKVKTVSNKERCGDKYCSDQCSETGA